MLASKIRIFLTFLVIGSFSINCAIAQEKGIDKDELLEEYKSSKGYQQLQAQMDEFSPLANIEVSFKLYRETSSGREDVSDSVDKIFMIIEQYPCNTYGANPKVSHSDDVLGTYEFQANIWDPQCITLDITSDKLNFSDGTEWNPESFPSDESQVDQQITIALSDGFVLEAETKWSRNKSPDGKTTLESKSATVTGTLMHFVPDSSDENSFTSEPLPNVEIAIPGHDITTDTDRNGNFMIREVPTGELLQLVTQSPNSETPDTLRFVAGSDRLMDMGKLYLPIDEK